MGAICKDSRRVGELIGPMWAAASKVPGMFPFITQAGLFQSRGTQGRSIKLELTGPDLKLLLAKSYVVFGLLKKAFPKSQVKRPDLSLGHPEVNIKPNNELIYWRNINRKNRL